MADNFNEGLQARVSRVISESSSNESSPETPTEAPQEAKDETGDVDKPQVAETPEQKLGAFTPLQKYYGIEKPEPTQIRQLEEVWNWFSSQEDIKDDGDVLKAVRNAHLDMVAPEVGQTRLSQLSDYVKILKDIRISEKQKEAYRKVDNGESNR